MGRPAMANAKAKATIQVEFETVDLNQARAALDRLQGGVRHSIEFPTVRVTGLVAGTLVVEVVKKSVDGQPA
jgi:hypothetical protein